LPLFAPHRGFGHSSTVSAIVAAAVRRAGLAPARRGAHLLRHTLASSLLRRGAPMREISELLGHREPQSTEVYARVDIASLQTVAQPWPGGGR
jgi:site-specific recombinase XerD